MPLVSCSHIPLEEENVEGVASRKVAFRPPHQLLQKKEKEASSLELDTPASPAKHRGCCLAFFLHIVFPVLSIQGSFLSVPSNKKPGEGHLYI